MESMFGQQNEQFKLQKYVHKKRIVAQAKEQKVPSSQINLNTISEIIQQAPPFTVHLDQFQNVEFKEKTPNLTYERFQPASPGVLLSQSKPLIESNLSLSECEELIEFSKGYQYQEYTKKRSQSQDQTNFLENCQEFFNFEDQITDFSRLNYKKKRSKSQEWQNIQKRRAFFGYNAEQRCKKQLK